MTKVLNRIPLKNIIIVIIAALAIWFLVVKCSSSKELANEESQVLVDTTEAQQVHLKYGLPIDDFEVETSVVKKRQSLSTILGKYGVNSAKVYEICQKSKDVFNVRKIRSGKSYSVLFSRDSIRNPEYFIYETNSRDYVVFDLQDEIEVYTGAKPVEYKTKTIKGTIESSLYMALKGAGGDPALSGKMSEIYQWTIDFFGISQGDSFKILYDQVYIEGKPIKDFDVKAAVLTHNGKDYFAYKYNQDGKYGYFDEEGQNLQKAFLKAPLKFSRISSRFSNRRFHPVLKRWRSHHGVDYAAPTGTPVYSVGDGKIIKKAYQRGGGGRYLTVKHNSIYKTQYMHLSRYAKGMRAGVRVKQGQIIGYVGQSGTATGPHLDYRVIKHGTPINPLKMKSPSKSPIKKANKGNYMVVKNQLEARLEEV